MKSLEYLNTHGQTSVAATDDRLARVIFDRVLPLGPVDQVKTVTTTSVSVDPGIEIIDIIQGDVANVRYQVKTVSASSPTLTSSITFSTLPTGVSQSTVDNTYTLSGIETVAQWNSVKSFTWNLASDWADCPFWYLEVSIIYFDEASGDDKTVKWIVYDENHYWVAQLTTAVTMSATVIRAKVAAAAVTAESTITVVGSKIKGAQAALTSNFSVTAIGTVMISSMLATVTMASNINAKFSQRSAMSSAFSMTVNENYVYTDDLRFQIYYDDTRTSFSATVITYQTNLVVFWGDGSSTSYTGTGDYRTHNITKSFTGTGYADIKVAATAVTRFKPSRASDKCLIYKIYNWSRVPTQGATTYFSNDYYNQVELTNVPDYLPTNVTTMNGTFASCTSLNDSNISSWNTAPLVIMLNVFDGCTSFNQPVSSWNVSNCDSLNSLFKGCTSFNQPISWTLKDGVDANSMLQNCTGFNQDLTALTINDTVTLNQFLNGCTSFSNINYNKFLIRLANLNSDYGGFPRNVNLGVPAGVTETSTSYGSLGFSTGTGSYSYLTASPRSWTITKA